MAKYQNNDDTIDIIEVKCNRMRSRQAAILQTWSMLASIAYDEHDYDAWFMDLSFDDIEIEKEIIAAAVENVQYIQKQFNQVNQERRRLRLVK